MSTYRIETRLSPNRSRRQQGEVSLIVLHSTEGNFEGAVSWLCNPQSQASAHYVVPRNPQAKPILQLVPLEEKAWHAGRSQWRGRTGVNEFSVGIEMEHFDRREDWPQEQVEAVAWLCAQIMAHLGKELEVVGHADVAVPRGRKIDPWEFPWERFRRELAHQRTSPPSGEGVRPPRVRVRGQLLPEGKVRLLEEGRVWVELRALLEALGVPFRWEEETKTVEVG